MERIISCLETDLEGNIVYANSSFFLTTGYSKEEILGKPKKILRHPDIPNMVFRDLWKTISLGESWFGVLKNKKKSGEDHWEYCFMYPVFKGYDIVAYRGLQMPVIDEMLKEIVEAHYQLLDGHDEKISLIRGKTYEDLAFNGTIEERAFALSYYIKEVCVLDFSLFYDALQGDRVDKIILAFLERLVNIMFEVSVSIDKIDNISVTNYHGEEISRKFLEGTLIGRLNQAIYKQQDRFIAQSRHSVMGEMIAMISHQWRQPLSVLKLNADIISLKIDSLTISEEDKAFLKQRGSVISEMVKEQSLLIEDFADFFKADKESRVFSVEKSIDQALFLLQSSLVSHGVELQKHVTKDLCLFGLERELRQVFVNIIKNAMDQLIEREINSPIIMVDARQVDQMIEIVIQDNGGGIAEHILPRIFEAYVSSKSLNGTGLGLYMVKLIILDSFKGEIVASNSDFGAVFTIRIPIGL